MKQSYIKKAMEFLQGATPTDSGVFFKIYTPHAKEVTIIIRETGLRSRLTLSNGYWEALIKDLPETFTYAFQTESHPHLLDPYAKEIWQGFGLVRQGHSFDWQGVLPPKINANDLILYEAHLQAFGKNYLDCIDRIPHLLSLGINAIEFLPLLEFNPSKNYWGYSPIHFFAPVSHYAKKQTPGSAADELKTLIRELHRNGILVISDVVYNHTGDSDLMKLAKSEYYLLSAGGRDTNYTGCGNTLNANHPRTSELILASLHHLADAYKFDGFRFDLASALTRGEDGSPLAAPPLIQSIATDFQEKVLIAEPWDAAGLYQVGTFPSKKFSEWNGKFRDDVRRFIKGTPGAKGAFATRIAGSGDLYKTPLSSLNFVTSHDGFTLNDLVSYNEKHNLANGEENRDGENNNESWNSGVEGETKDPEILALRTRQMKNFLMALLLAQGIPMIRSGDEFKETKKGNNNTWCTATPIEGEPDPELFPFLKQLIAFRKNTPCLRSPGAIEWHSTLPGHPLWSEDDRFIAATLCNEVYFAFNASSKPMTITLPKGNWKTVVSSGDGTNILPPYSAMIGTRIA